MDTTTLDYALMAGEAYFYKRREANQIPMPIGASSLGQGLEGRTLTSGYEARAYRKTGQARITVAEVNLRYVASARLDDLLTVSAQVVEQGNASMVIAQQAWRGETLLADGWVRVGCVDGVSFRPRRIPKQVLDALGSKPLN